jgi:hypothetical protein
MRPALLVTVLLPFLSALPSPAQSAAGGPATAKVIFSALGDAPYFPGEDEVLPLDLEQIDPASEFVIHLGDIKTGRVPCDESIYAKVAGMLAQSKPRVFIIPGDNEWNDCADPDAAWQLWDKHFMGFHDRWSGSFPVARQTERPENFAFTRGGVIFVGINLVGGLVHDAAEWKTRHALNLALIEETLRQHGAEATSMVVFAHAKPGPNHADFVEGFSDAAARFAKPVLFLHGDGHRWIQDHPFPAKNVMRVQVDQGSLAPPILVTVTDDPAEPFVIDRRRLPGQDGLLSLADFQDAAGWMEAAGAEAGEKPKTWASLTAGTGLMVNGPEGKAGNLLSRFAHGDAIVEMEFMIPKGSNSGVYLQSRYEIQIFDSHGKPDEKLTVHDAGAIYERWDEDREPKGYEGTAPAVNACKAPGEWQTLEIQFRAPRFDGHGVKTSNATFVSVRLNGVLLHENIEVSGPTRGGLEPEAVRAPLKIQGDHGPVAIRRLSLRPLK